LLKISINSLNIRKKKVFNLRLEQLKYANAIRERSYSVPRLRTCKRERSFAELSVQTPRKLFGKCQPPSKRRTDGRTKRRESNLVHLWHLVAIILINFLII